MTKQTKIILAGLMFCVAHLGVADEVEKSDGVVHWSVSEWPADGKVIRPDGVGNITTAYVKGDAARMPLTVEFNKDATVVTIHGPKNHPKTLVLETAENTGATGDGRVVFSALDSKVEGVQAKLETHPGNHRIGFWGNAQDYVSWKAVDVPAGTYEVELTYSTASPSGTQALLEFGETALPVTLKTTGSWYRYTTLPAGELVVKTDSQQSLNVKCVKKVGGAVMNLKAVVLRPKMTP